MYTACVTVVKSWQSWSRQAGFKLVKLLFIYLSISQQKGGKNKVFTQMSVFDTFLAHS